MDSRKRAFELGQDDAERHEHGTLTERCYSGREVAARLGIERESPDQLVALRESYNAGWSSYL
jgi:hypothetical protein